MTTTRLLALGLSFAFAVSTVSAQPKDEKKDDKKAHKHRKEKAPAPAPAPATPTAAPATPTPAPAPTPSPMPPTPPGSGSGSGSGSGVGETAGTDETLEKGTGDRPWANGVSKSEQQTALKSFHEGNLMLNQGLFAKATDSYKDALKHWDHPAIHYNLALAMMNLDQPIEAMENFEASIKFGDTPLQSKDKFDNAKGYILALDKSIAEVEVTCKKTGAKISIDDKDVFTAPGTYKGKVRAGPHKFIATLEGHPTRVDATYVSPGAPFRIELKLYTTKELTRYRRKWDATWMPYAVIGGGIVVAGIGGLVELAASSNFKDYDRKIAECNQMTGNNGGCAQSADLRSLRDSGETKRTTGFVLYGVAGAAILTGAVLAYINRPESYEVRPEDLNSAVGNPITFAPVVAPDFAGASVTGSF